MKTPADAVASYIDAEVRDFAHRRAEESRPFVTISRQTGAGGITVGRLLSAYLQTQGIAAGDGTPWKVFDRDLIAEVLRACDLPARVEPYMTESKTSEFNDSLEEMFGLHPAKWLLVKKTSETILHLAGLGHVILVGRGANVVTAKLDGGFHVRLVGSFARRVEHLMAYDDLGEAQAAETVKKEDRDRRAYLKKYFNRDIDDPLLYDLVINTDRVAYGEAAAMIGRSMLLKAFPASVAPA